VPAAVSEPSLFWAEWQRRAPGERRSLDRARSLAASLGLTGGGPPLLTVVGSKGKGTAATYASAYLAAAGQRVVTVTSPGLRGSRDRVRLQGRSVAGRELAALAARLAAGRASLPAYQPGTGYLSPSGLFILAGLIHARAAGADAVVLEAGQGGRCDEVSLFPPDVVAITEIFGEHLGVLGGSAAEIAAEKAGVVTAETVAVLSLPQDEPVTSAIAQTLAARAGGAAAVEFVAAGASGVPAGLFPAGFGAANAELGCVAAQRLLDAVGAAPPAAGCRSRTLSSVILPGRLSWHALPGTDAELFTDAAINRAGIRAALEQVRRRWDTFDRVLACFPDHKDVAGAVAELAGLPVTCVRLGRMPALRFTSEVPAAWQSVDAEQIDIRFLAASGPRVVALGTVYFIGHLLTVAGVDTERLFAAPSAAHVRRRQQAMPAPKEL
jgi:dihydrofolate synthase / folylpolyglutamate synthase